jgi:hypothetical protein
MKINDLPRADASAAAGSPADLPAEETRQEDPATEDEAGE